MIHWSQKYQSGRATFSLMMIVTAAVAEYIRTKALPAADRLCPADPGLVGAADRAALEQYAVRARQDATGASGRALRSLWEASLPLAERDSPSAAPEHNAYRIPAARICLSCFPHPDPPARGEGMGRAGPLLR